MTKAIGILVVVALAAAPTGFDRAAAEDGALVVGGATSVKDVLAKQAGKAVVLRLRGGEEIGGKVRTVGDQVVHLSEVAGRDFYDAVVRVDGIDAVLVRVRGR